MGRSELEWEALTSRVGKHRFGAQCCYRSCVTLGLPRGLRCQGKLGLPFQVLLALALFSHYVKKAQKPEQNIKYCFWMWDNGQCRRVFTESRDQTGRALRSPLLWAHGRSLHCVQTGVGGRETKRRGVAELKRKTSGFVEDKGPGAVGQSIREEGPMRSAALETCTAFPRFFLGH